MKLWSWLSGKKTYLIAIAGFIYAGGVSKGWWQHDVLIDGLLGSGGLASLRHGISTAAPDQPAPK